MKLIERLKILLSEQLIPIQIWIAYHQPSTWVSTRAKKLIEKSKKKDKKGFSDSLSEKWFEWMHPQRWRASLTLALALIAIPQFALGFLPLHVLGFIDETFLIVIWQVLASIIGISFVIVVFLTEYSQDQTYERRAFPIYISATSMIFTVMMGLLTLMNMGVNLIFIKSPFANNNWVIAGSIWNSLLFFINLILVIVLYIRTYQLLSPSYFRKTLIKYHRKKVLERVYQELLNRVKRNLSIQYMQKIGIDVSIFKDFSENKHKVKTNRQFTENQTIDDLNLSLLKIAKKNAEKITGLEKTGKIYFWGLPGNNISNEYSEIAFIDFELNKNTVTKFLQISIKTKPWHKDKLDTSSEDLLINRDLISVAISSGQAENVEASLELYIETIEAFLDSLETLGYRFTPELVDHEDSWFNKWDIFDNVHQQYTSLLREALKSDNTEIINEFISFPRKVMIKALKYQDHFAFKRFINLYPLIYNLSTRYISNTQTREQVTNKCGQYISEFAHYWIEPKLSQSDIKEESLQEQISYIESLLIVYSQIAKLQIDNLDYSQFRLTIGSIRKILNSFSEKHEDYKLHNLIFQVEHLTDESIKKETVRELEKEKKLNSLVSHIRNIRRSALFGLGAWLCHLVDTGKLSSEGFGILSRPISQEFENLNILNDSYINAISMEDRGKFNWSSWEMDEWPDESYGEGKFGSINFSSWLSLFHTYQAIVLTPDNQVHLFDIKPSPEIKGLLDSIKSNIKHLTENKNWDFLLDKLGELKVRGEILEKSFEASYAKQVVVEELEIINTPISEIRLRNFINEAEKAWREQGDLRILFSVNNKYLSAPESSPQKKVEPYGVYQRIPKGVFIDQPRIGYSNWGEAYGRSMAQGENSKIISYLSALPVKKASLRNFDKEISKQVAVLKSKGYTPIILCGREFHDYLFNSKNYEPHWKTIKPKPQGIANFDGYYNDSIVLLHPTASKTVLICDFSKFGTLVQFKVNEKMPDFPLQFSIKEISIERAKEYLIKYPNLLKNSLLGKEISSEEAIRKIQQDVELAIWQRNHIQDIDAKAGVIIEFRQTKGAKN